MSINRWFLLAELVDRDGQLWDQWNQDNPGDYHVLASVLDAIGRASEGSVSVELADEICELVANAYVRRGDEDNGA